MLLVFPSQKVLVLVFQRSEVRRMQKVLLLPLHRRIFPEDPQILPIDSAIEPQKSRVDLFRAFALHSPVVHRAIITARMGQKLRHSLTAEFGEE